MTLAHIQPQHDAIHARCIEWAKWVRVHHRPFGIQPMFKGYMSKSRQWEEAPPVPVAVNTLQALEVERAVATLPDQQRTVLRWAYVWPALHINAVARELGTSGDGLVAIRDAALDGVGRAIMVE